MRAPASDTRRPIALAGLAAVFIVAAVGCGGKTGLDLPDAQPDGSVDAGTDAAVPCVEVPPDGGVAEVPLDTVARLRRADVVFLVDVTLSMRDEIDQIRARLRDTLAPAIEGQIPDSQLAVATHGDFPIDPYGASSDSPFQLVVPMTSDLARAQAGVDSLRLGDGADQPESQVEALYQIATGEGLGPWIPPAFGCPSGGYGYPCFRDDSLPIVMMFTDAPMHNGPTGTNPYSTIAPPPHTYVDAVRELTARGIRVIGLESGGGQGRRDLESIARDTGAIGPAGPLVYDIGTVGERLDDGVVSAIRTFADSVRFDVDTVLVDPEPGDGIDVRTLVERVEPVRAEPMSGVESIDVAGGAFRGVHAGTRVVFRILVRNDAIPPSPHARRFRLGIIFRGDRRTRLGEAEIVVVIPGTDGSGCDDAPRGG